MIYIFFAPPREGKTYCVTAWALKELAKNKRRVFSNYPIVTDKVSTLVWKPDLVDSDIVDSLIIIDEAYRDFNSRNFKNFSSSEHFFFATNGHNNIDIILIAHSPARLDTVIREMASYFFFVKKVHLPFSTRPLWFRVEGFLDEISLSQRFVHKTLSYSVEHYLFKRSVARAYDTHYFRKNIITPTVYSTWAETLGGVGPVDSNNLLLSPSGTLRDGMQGLRAWVSLLLAYLRGKDRNWYMLSVLTVAVFLWSLLRLL
ncbi:MAG TPA: zonular occludens toxin domain-containing protein [Clostridia bacterium]|nr:zonular occludens toxin domain-containing protein [Clostridia bacterium]